MKNLLKEIESLECHVNLNGVDKESFYTLLAIVKNVALKTEMLDSEQWKHRKLGGY